MGRSRKSRPEVELDIKSIGMEGVSVARDEGQVYFVEGGIPGDKVIAQVTKKRKRYREARIKRILEPSPNRQDPKCKHFWDCGGCKWQHLPYIQQLYWKEKNVRDAMERLGNLHGLSYERIIESPEQYHYRNKMEFSFSAHRWLSYDEIETDEKLEDKGFALGLHAPGNFAKVIDVEFCHIQPQIGNEILSSIRTKAKQLDLTAHDAYTNTGFLRNLVIRTGTDSKEMMVILITRKPESDSELLMSETFPELLPSGMEYTTFHAINDGKNPRTIDSFELLGGNGYIKSEILGVEFRVSPFTFFQTNTSQLDRFLGKAIDEAQLNEDEIIWDLYCGTGSLTLPAAKKAKKVIGIELVQESIDFAKENASLNGIENCDFHAADLHTKKLPDLFNQLEKPDTIITDPPRAGMHPNIVNHILEVAPNRIVYVSCNPATQARDLALISEVYNIIKIIPVDLFPHTYHIESIAILEKK
ncbi:MAG: 23S rRNA (uracil(1939)-C(5))-methyltransferase RlmD [Candidatus Kapaibacteriales bacterium]